MKILFLSQRFLMPMDTGGKIRTGNILKQLSKQHAITLISNMEISKDKPYLPKIRSFCSKFISVPWRETRKYSFLFFIRLFCQVFSIYPVSVLNDYSRNLRLAVEKELSSGAYDIAICDFVQSALLFKNVKRIPTILFQHNVESMIAQRHVTQNRNRLIKLFWWLQWKKMSCFEKKACHKFSTVIAVSENDKKAFKDLYHAVNVKTIPTGVDIDYYRPTPDTDFETNSLVFCGSMDWLPNEDAVIHFIKDILPEIKLHVKGSRLTVVGRNPTSKLEKIVQKNPEVVLTGWVKDTRPYIAKSALFIVPIRIGGGTRMKIYEAMAMEKAVISTSVGAEGLPVKHNENIVIADDPKVFGKKIAELLMDAKERDRLARNARDFVLAHFTWGKVAATFSNICQDTKANQVKQ